MFISLRINSTYRIHPEIAGNLYCYIQALGYFTTLSGKLVIKWTSSSSKRKSRGSRGGRGSSREESAPLCPIRRGTVAERREKRDQAQTPFKGCCLLALRLHRGTDAVWPRFQGASHAER